MNSWDNIETISSSTVQLHTPYTNKQSKTTGQLRYETKPSVFSCWHLSSYSFRSDDFKIWGKLKLFNLWDLENLLSLTLLNFTIDLVLIPTHEYYANFLYFEVCLPSNPIWLKVLSSLLFYSLVKFIVYIFNQTGNLQIFIIIIIWSNRPPIAATGMAGC